MLYLSKMKDKKLEIPTFMGIGKKKRRVYLI